MKKKFVLGALCVSMILASGIGASAEVSESHSQWAEKLDRYEAAVEEILYF